MPPALSVDRSRILLGTLLVSWFLVLSLQAKREGSERSWLEETVLRVLEPTLLAGSRLADGARNVGTGLVDLRSAAVENRQLREQLRDRELEIIRLRHLEGEVRRLEELMAYRAAAAPEGMLARVVYADTRGWFKSVLLDRGSRDGAGDGSPVLDARGVVGRVVRASPGISKVQLLIDSNAAAGCLVERTRLQGVARGDGGAGMILHYVPRIGDVQVGDRVLTAGNDGIYPPGLLLGTVVSSEEGEEMFREIRIRPAVEFTSLEALLVLPPRPREPVPAEVTP